MVSKWTSNAQWPDEVSTGTVTNVTTDTHNTEDQARHVCKSLRKHGLGGMGQVFPVSVWWEEAKQENE